MCNIAYTAPDIYWSSNQLVSDMAHLVNSNLDVNIDLSKYEWPTTIEIVYRGDEKYENISSKPSRG